MKKVIIPLDELGDDFQGNYGDGSHYSHDEHLINEWMKKHGLAGSCSSLTVFKKTVHVEIMC